MIKNRVSEYYSNAFDKFGRQPKGVDWNDENAQVRRFERLTSHLPQNESFSVLDYGCGYGALYDFLKNSGYSFDYHGFDIAESIIAETKAHYAETEGVSFYTQLPKELHVNFAILNGVFHVKLEHENATWEEHIRVHLQELMKHVKTSVSVNFLSLHSDPEKRKSSLFYAHPTNFAEKLSSEFGWNIEVHEHPALYEFVLIIQP